MTPVELKIGVANIAAILAGAQMTNLPDDLKTSPDISDPDLRAENLMGWELFRLYYHAVVGAMDADNWPTPKGGVAGGSLPSLLQPLAGQTGQIGTLATQLLALLAPVVSGPAPAPAPIPNPTP